MPCQSLRNVLVMYIAISESLLCTLWMQWIALTKGVCIANYAAVFLESFISLVFKASPSYLKAAVFAFCVQQQIQKASKRPNLALQC